jgi:exosortase/archaeosortase family protein
MNLLTDKKFLLFVAKFLLIFCILYFGTFAIIGLSSPVGYYSGFVAHYLDYVSGIKILLLQSTKGILSLFGISTSIKFDFTIGYSGGNYVHIARDCVGFGVYSFWAAYVVANKIPLKQKIMWAVGGVLLLFIINDLRITLLLVAINKGWAMPLGIDHHTWFNIFAYLAIFIMIFYFEKSQRRNIKT